MIYITGDTHSYFKTRLSEFAFPEQSEMTKDDIVIICGDFGGIWYNINNMKIRQEDNNLDWLNARPFTTVFVDGNHENFDRLRKHKIKEWNGGKVHEIRPNVLHLMRGEIYNIDGCKIFVFGGAKSHDIRDGILKREGNWKKTYEEWATQGKQFRIEGISWWKEELPSSEEMEYGLENLRKHNNKVDYIVTHSPSASMLALLGNGRYEQDILSKYLEEIRVNTEYKKWFCGHMHDNKAINDKDLLLYEQIIRIW